MTLSDLATPQSEGSQAEGEPSILNEVEEVVPTICAPVSTSANSDASLIIILVSVSSNSSSMDSQYEDAAVFDVQADPIGEGNLNASQSDHTGSHSNLHHGESAGTIDSKFLLPNGQEVTQFDQIIGDPSSGVQTRRNEIINFCLFVNVVSKYDLSRIEEALEDLSWVSAMQEELTQFKRNKFWKLVPAQAEKTIIGTKWIYRNKLDK